MLGWEGMPGPLWRLLAAPGLVAREEVRRRAASWLFLEIDVGERLERSSQRPILTAQYSKFLSIMLKVSAMRIPLAVTIISIAMLASPLAYGQAASGKGQPSGGIPTDAAGYRPAKRCAQ